MLLLKNNIACKLLTGEKFSVKYNDAVIPSELLLENMRQLFLYLHNMPPKIVEHANLIIGKFALMTDTPAALLQNYINASGNVRDKLYGLVGGLADAKGGNLPDEEVAALSHSILILASIMDIINGSSRMTQYVTTADSADSIISALDTNRLSDNIMTASIITTEVEDLLYPNHGMFQYFLDILENGTIA